MCTEFIVHQTEHLRPEQHGDEMAALSPASKVSEPKAGECDSCACDLQSTASFSQLTIIRATAYELLQMPVEATSSSAYTAVCGQGWRFASRSYDS